MTNFIRFISFNNYMLLACVYDANLNEWKELKFTKLIANERFKRKIVQSIKYLIRGNFKWSYANRKIKNRFTIRACKNLIIYEKISQTNTNVIYHFLHLFIEIYTYITFPLSSSDLYKTRTVSCTYRGKNFINITCCITSNTYLFYR